MAPSPENLLRRGERRLQKTALPIPFQDSRWPGVHRRFKWQLLGGPQRSLLRLARARMAPLPFSGFQVPLDSLRLPRYLELRRYPHQMPYICSKASALPYSALQLCNSYLLSSAGVLRTENDLMTGSHSQLWILHRPSSHLNSALTLTVKSNS